MKNFAVHGAGLGGGPRNVTLGSVPSDADRFPGSRPSRTKLRDLLVRNSGGSVLCVPAYARRHDR